MRFICYLATATELIYNKLFTNPACTQHIFVILDTLFNLLQMQHLLKRDSIYKTIEENKWKIETSDFAHDHNLFKFIIDIH